MSNPFLGEIRMFAGNFAPRGFALCNGQLLSIAQNSALFSLLGTTYGGDGQQTYALPNLQSRVPIGQGQGNGLSSRVMGESIGTESVTLITSQIPNHQHAHVATTNPATAASGPSGAPAASATTNFYGSGAADLTMAPTAIGAAGGGLPHNNVAPYLALNFIIAVEGVFPSRN
jgi:microcystin-dependent protein